MKGAGAGGGARGGAGSSSSSLSSSTSSPPSSSAADAGVTNAAKRLLVEKGVCRFDELRGAVEKALGQRATRDLSGLRAALGGVAMPLPNRPDVYVNLEAPHLDDDHQMAYRQVRKRASEDSSQEVDAEAEAEAEAGVEAGVGG